jgi:hypothetical protein
VADIKIQFLAFDGCPFAEAARHALDEAMASLGLRSYEVVDILDPDTPDSLRNWGSPTILVNGHDVSGGKQGNNVGCRLYAGPLRVPDSQAITDCLRREIAS